MSSYDWRKFATTGVLTPKPVNDGKVTPDVGGNKIETFMRMVVKHYNLTSIVQIRMEVQNDRGICGELTPMRCLVFPYKAKTPTGKEIIIRFSVPMDIPKACINMSVGNIDNEVATCVLPSVPKRLYRGTRYSTDRPLRDFSCPNMLKQLSREAEVVALLQ